MGRINSRSKGSSFERQVAKMIIETFARDGITDKDCYRTPLSGGHIHASKTDPGDVVLSPKLRKLFPWSVECKSYRSLPWVKLMALDGKRGAFDAWWAQTVKAAKNAGGVEPMLVFKQNGSEPFVMFPRDGSISIIHSKPCILTNIGSDRVMVMRFKRFLGLQYGGKKGLTA